GGAEAVTASVSAAPPPAVNGNTDSDAGGVLAVSPDAPAESADAAAVASSGATFLESSGVAVASTAADSTGTCRVESAASAPSDNAAERSVPDRSGVTGFRSSESGSVGMGVPS